MSYPLIIGTAGHIDHGKSALVRALTGQDPDRLPEERQREMTIDLGFAFWGDDVAIIDVPGHERLIRNMVAGVSGIDLVLLVVAADEGVKPQTLEHLQILQLLGIKTGIVALTKVDLVDGDTIEERGSEVEALLLGTSLEGAPITPLSALTGEGLEEFKQTLKGIIEGRKPQEEGEVFRLPVDRSFSIRGFGTVVTGTVISGRIKVGEEVELLPAKRSLGIRGIEVMGKPRQEVRRGMRAALNLRGIGKGEVRRGDTLATPSFFQPTRRLEVRFSLLDGFPGRLKGGQWLKFLTGTAEVMGKAYPLDGEVMRGGESHLVRFNLEGEITAALGDSFIVRLPSPPSTIGGGEILDPYPPARRKGVRLGYLKALEERRVAQVIETRLVWKGYRGETERGLWRQTQLPLTQIRGQLKELVNHKRLVSLKAGDRILFYPEGSLRGLKGRMISEVEEFHRQNPHRLGMEEEELKGKVGANWDIFRNAIKELIETGELLLHHGRRLGLSSHRIPLSPNDERLREKIEEAFLQGGFSPPSPKEMEGKDVRRMVVILQEMGILISAGDSLLFHHKCVEKAEELLRGFVQKKGGIRVTEFKGLLGTSRKFALSLLTYFDNQGITRRIGEIRKLR